MEVSYCVVNTNGRELLLELPAVDPRDPSRGIEHEILVLDNASDDGSAEAVEAGFPEVRVIRRDRRAGLAENNSLIMGEASGEFCLLLNEDSELLDGAVRELLDALGVIAKPRSPGRSSWTRTASRFPAPGGFRAWRRLLPRRSSSTGASSPRATAATARRGRWGGFSRARC